jgi:hypothetical protein
MLNRRSFLLGATGLCAVVPVADALASGALPTLTSAEIVTLAGNTDTALLNAVKGIAVAEPGLIPADTVTTITNDLTIGQGAAQTLTTNLPAAQGATTVKTINGYINAVMNTLAAPPINGLIPAPFNEAIAAVAIAMPTLEGFVDTYILGASAPLATAGARAKLAKLMPMSLDEAKATLARYAASH